MSGDSLPNLLLFNFLLNSELSNRRHDITQLFNLFNLRIDLLKDFIQKIFFNLILDSFMMLKFSFRVYFKKPEFQFII